MPSRLLSGFCCLLVFLPMQSLAYTSDELDTRFMALQNQLQSASDRVRMNGFFSFVGTRLHKDGYSYRDDTTSDPSFENLSRLGLQFDFRISEDTRLVTQLLSRGWKGWESHAEWAFLSHRFSPDLTGRAGRLRTPLFINSEFIDAGFAYPWAAPPAEIYSLLSFTSYEGIDLRYNFDALGGLWSVQPFFGYVRLTEREERAGLATGDEIHGFDLSANWGNFSARAGYFAARASTTSSLGAIATGINQSIREGIATSAAEGAVQGALFEAGCGPGGTADFATCTNIQQSVFDETFDATLTGLAISLPDPDVTIDRNKSSFFSVGFSYDDGKWLLMTEYGKGEFEGFLPDSTSCYGTLGYRIGKLMPHLTYSHIRADDPEERRFQDVAWTTPPPAPPQEMDNPGGAFLQQVFNLDQESWIAGVRYDHGHGVALKLEAQRSSGFDTDSTGLFAPANPDASHPDHIWVYRVALDVMF